MLISMSDAEYKKFTLQAKRGIKGEAFFESLISNHSLPIQIVGLKDIGIDYICQWVYEDKPTPILYAVQVKTFAITNKKKPKYIRIRKNFNNLKEYRIANNNLQVENKTFAYWHTLSMPVYLFAICDTGQEMSVFYKRYTPILTKPNKSPDFYSEFYKVNNGSEFLAFADSAKQTGGFARDLFIDYIRWHYSKGFIMYVNPRTMGLQQFPDREYAIFEDLFDIYKDKVLLNYKSIKPFLEKHCT